MKTLSFGSLMALGFMTFALFLGAGNLIFPPAAGLAAGANMGTTALGFLVTAVGLPLLTLVALARVGGGMDTLTSPLGRLAGLALTVLVYLSIGPFFATPRTAVVSYELGIAPFLGHGWAPQLLYTLLFFALVIGLSLRPGRLVVNIGQILTPVLLLGLAVLGLAALLFPVGTAGEPQGDYVDSPLIEGVLQGYLTMDSLGALVFGIVITTAIHDQQVHSKALVTRYTIVAALLAAVGLALVYLALFRLGATSGNLVPAGANGGKILSAFVHHRFGVLGGLLLGLVISLACLTTAVGLISACGEFFSRNFPVSHRAVVLGFSLFSLWVANHGLDTLIQVSIPVLVGLYPLTIVLVCLGLLLHDWARPQNIMRPVMLVTLVFGVMDGLKAAGLLAQDAPAWLRMLPLASQGLGWLVPALAALVVAVLVDRIRHGKLRMA